MLFCASSTVLAKVRHPVGDLDLLVVALQRGVVILARALDGPGKRDQARLAEILRQRFFRERAADAAVAVLEGVDADEIEMRDAGARQRGQRGLAVRRRPVEPRDEALHFRGHARMAAPRNARCAGNPGRRPPASVPHACGIRRSP